MTKEAPTADWTEGKKEIAAVGKTAQQSDSNSIMAIISRAATDPTFDVAKLDHLLAVKERWEKEEARKAFVSALNAFKADPPEIFKNKTVSFKDTKYKHASLDQVSISIASRLAEHNLSHRWNVEQREGQIKVTCVLMHSAGHSESVSLVAGADQSGSKNPIQSIGSTVTYLQRYSLLASTGMAVQDEDDDGHKSTGQAAAAHDARAALKQGMADKVPAPGVERGAIPAEAVRHKTEDCCNRKSAMEEHKTGCPHAPKPKAEPAPAAQDQAAPATAATKKRPF